MASVAENLARVRERIAVAAGRAGRDVGGVRLVAVSKTHPASAVREALAAGQREFGESRVQEALPKIAGAGDGPEWHFIGHLQTNKVRKAVGRFALFHGVDNEGLAAALNRVAGEFGTVARVLLEVNVSGEGTKFGFAPGSVEGVLEGLLQMPFLRVEGLMAMAPYSEDPESARPVFAGLRELRDRLAGPTGAALPELSMGMSGDFEQGIAEGATIVRVGSAVFGDRGQQG